MYMMALLSDKWGNNRVFMNGNNLMKKRIIYYQILLLFIASCTPTMTVTKRMAFENANMELAKIGEYEIKNMQVEISKHNSPYSEYLPKDSVDEYALQVIKKLKNKEYWAIYYYPIEGENGSLQSGGDLCIFIDARSGGVISVVRYK